jgi:hypothetical protein
MLPVESSLANLTFRAWYVTICLYEISRGLVDLLPEEVKCRRLPSAGMRYTRRG